MESIIARALRAATRRLAAPLLVICALSVALVCGLAEAARAEHNVATASDPDFAAVAALGCNDEFLTDRAEAISGKCWTAAHDEKLSAKQRAFAYFAGSLALTLLGRDWEALAQINSSIELNPNFAQAYARRGFINQSISKEHAVEDLRKALSMGYSKGSVADILPSLRRDCPTLVFRDNVCQTGATPVTVATQYKCTERVNSPDGCASIHIASSATDFMCEPGFPVPEGCTAVGGQQTVAQVAPAGGAASSGEVPSLIVPGEAPAAASPTQGGLLRYTCASLRLIGKEDRVPAGCVLAGRSGDEVTYECSVPQPDFSTCRTSQAAAPVTPAPSATVPPATTKAPSETPCEPNVHVDITAKILTARPPSQNGDPWTLDLMEQQGQCALAAIQTSKAPPAACVDDATVSASGKVFDQTLQDPGDLRCVAAGQAQGTPSPAEPAAPPVEKRGWLSWLWGSKKTPVAPVPAPAATAPAPAPAAPVAAPAATEGPTTTVTYAGKELVLIAPPGMCLVPADSELLDLLVNNNVLAVNGEVKRKVLAGYKDCDTPADRFRSVIGVYFAPDLPAERFQDQTLIDRMRTTIAEICRPEQAPGVYAPASGAFDDQVSAKVDAGAKKAITDPNRVSQDLVLLGQRGNACNTIGVWAMGEKEARHSYVNLQAMLVMKDRAIFWSDNSYYLGQGLARAHYERFRQMLDRLQALNPGN